MAQVATPVSVVTSTDGKTPCGTTVSAFSSLSIAPPMVLVCLDRGSQTLEYVLEHRRFALNILASDQTETAVRFASKKGTEKFDAVSWHTEDGLPRLANVAGWVGCNVNSVVDGGDHLVVMGVVTSSDTSRRRPLTYHGRCFGTYSALDESLPA
ncbi:flavin reductase family protein [Gordonia terrae]